MPDTGYGEHGFKELEKLYCEKPYQGQNPQVAKVIFLGRDANYPRIIGDSDFFKFIIEYHRDGVAFWKKYGIHHPFLHPEYPYNKNKDKRYKDGVKYHEVFAKMCLSAKYAEYISFVEILNRPTAGNTGQDTEDWFEKNISDGHIAFLEETFRSAGKTIIFIPKTVIGVDLKKVKDKTGRFAWLLAKDRNSDKDEPDCILTEGKVSFYKCNHFSGAISNHHLCCISNIIRNCADPYIWGTNKGAGNGPASG